ncbi:MAG: ABC transporter substrate-binding protein, partial [Saprospiraceae bacterium]
SMNGDQGVVLVKKKDWWGDDQAKAFPMLAVYPEQLVYKIVKEEAAIQSLLQTGDLDIVTDVSTGLFLTMQQDTHLTRMYDFKSGWAPRYGRMILNLRQSDSNLLTDVRIRKALAYVVDYDYLINTVQQGFAQPIIGPIHPAKPYYAKNIPGYTYNPAEVKRLLTEAGWKDSDKDGVLDKVVNGKRSRLSLHLMNPSGSAISEAVAKSIVEKARQSQIEIILDPQDISNVTKKTMAGQFEMANIGASTQTGLDELNQYYHSESPDNRGRYRNARLDSIIEAIQVTQDVPTRNALYVEAQQIIHDDVPMVFLYSSIRRYIVSKKYNYVLTAVGPGFYEQMFQRKEEPLK